MVENGNKTLQKTMLEYKAVLEFDDKTYTTVLADVEI